MCSRVRPLERAGGGFDCGYPVEVQVWVELPSPLPPHIPSVSLPRPHPSLFCADREGGDLCPRPRFASPWRWAPSPAFSFSGAPSGFFASFLSVRGVLWFCATGAVRRLWLCSWWWCCSCHYVTVSWGRRARWPSFWAVRRLWLCSHCSWWWCCSCHYVTVSWGRRARWPSSAHPHVTHGEGDTRHDRERPPYPPPHSTQRRQR